MQVTKKYYDRRHVNEKYSDRRHVNRRINARSGNPRRCSPRRSDTRLNLSFGVSVLDHNGKTVNVSARGAYFKVTTDSIEAFPPGTSIPLQINAATNTSEGREKKFILFGTGTVIRNCIIENPDHTDSLGVALKFTEKLNTEFDND